MGLRENINLKLVLIYLIVSISVFQSGVDFQMSMFIYYPPQHRCKVPNETDVITTVDNCFYYKKDSQIKKPCTKWVFDKSQIKSTFVTELKLICDRQYLQLILVPVRNLSGILVVFLGILSDIKGRKIMFIFCATMDTINWVLLGLLPSKYVIHAILRFIKIFGIGSSVIGFVLLSELTPKKYRNILIINYWSLFSLGLAFSPIYVKYTSHWQTAWLLASWPMFFYVLAPYLMLESPKWLLVNNQRNKAVEVLRQLDQYSESPSDNDEDELIEIKEEIKQVEEAEEFCKSGVLMSRLVVLLLASTGFYLVYQGVSTNLEFAISDIYINAVIMGLIEIPAGPLGCLSRTYIGSVTSVVFWTVTGLVTYLIIPGNWDSSISESTVGKISHVILASFAKFFMVLSWNVLGIFYVGLFPTNKRNFASVLGESFGFIGAAIGAFVGYYFTNPNQSSEMSVALVIYSLVMIVSMILFGLVIPSINNTDLPNTVEEAKNIKKSFNCCLCVTEEKEYSKDI